MTRPEYENRYQNAYSQQGLKALHEAFGLYTTWDDHEVYDNWQGENTPRSRAGQSAFYSHQPIRPSFRKQSGEVRPWDPSDAEIAKKLWRSHKWGDTLELFILDCRSERSRVQGKYISNHQMKWLLTAVKDSTAVFKFILNSCPIGRLSDTPAKRKRDKGGDRWDAPDFGGQRDAILRKLNRKGGVIWLSGDVHFGAVGSVDWHDRGSGARIRYPRMCEVIMGPSGSKPNRITNLVEINRTRNAEPVWSFATSETNYVVIDVSAKMIKKLGKPPKPDPSSTVTIRFYNGPDEFYRETRNYNMRIKKRSHPPVGPRVIRVGSTWKAIKRGRRGVMFSPKKTDHARNRR